MCLNCFEPLNFDIYPCLTVYTVDMPTRVTSSRLALSRGLLVFLLYILRKLSSHATYFSDWRLCENLTAKNSLSNQPKLAGVTEKHVGLHPLIHGSSKLTLTFFKLCESRKPNTQCPETWRAENRSCATRAMNECGSQAMKRSWSASCSQFVCRIYAGVHFQMLPCLS